MRKKQFKPTFNETVVQPIYDHVTSNNNTLEKRPAQTLIEFGESTVSLRYFDFALFYEKGCDDIVSACQQVIESMVIASRKTHGQTLSMTSIISYCNRGMATFLPFCAAWSHALKRDLTLEDIKRNLIQKFIIHLGSTELSVTSQKNTYTLTKSVLMALSRQNLISPDIFPANPYPKINHQKKGERALSKSERAQVFKALGSELQYIASGEGSMSFYELGICAFAIAARTGLNPTPLLELPIDCLQQHPLKPSHRLLVSFKRRGKNTHIQSIRKSETLEFIVPVKATQVSVIIDLVLTRNKEIRKQSKYSQFLFVGKSRGGSSRGENRRLTNRLLSLAADELMNKYKLEDDDGNPINLNVMRLRKTFANHIWELSGQDTFVSAAVLGHGMRAHNDHYLEAPLEAKKHWNFMGKVLVESLLQAGNATEVVKENTPVAGCSDNLNGDRAPKNGSHCTSFLNCFICKNFVVTGDDLYRVYSLYWLLVRERERIGVHNWSRYYAHIIRIVDRQIAPQFDEKEVFQARANAKNTPHPFWRDPQMLQVGV